MATWDECLVLQLGRASSGGTSCRDYGEPYRGESQGIAPYRDEKPHRREHRWHARQDMGSWGPSPEEEVDQ